MEPKPISIAANADCELGECPLWDEQKRCIYWTDIPAGKIFRLNPASKKCEVIYHDSPVGGFTIQENGDLLLFRVDDIALLHPDGTVSVLKKYTDEGMSRFNDVIADPAGRVFAGTIGKTRESGGLYRIDCDGTITQLFAGTACSNGMGFSPDQKTFYWTCTTTRHIFQFDYDRTTGELSNRRVFLKTTDDGGLPDGLTIDAEGNIWSARWGGAAIVHLSSKGETLERIQFPVTNITSFCFGGEKLDQLFVTSAKNKAKEEKSAGALFQLPMKIRGLKEFRSRVKTP